MKDFAEIVTPPSKKLKEGSRSPNTPVTEAEKAHSFHDRSRLVLRYFEKFKIANKKKLTAVSQQELNRGVDLVSELLTEVCNENMIIYGRYLELKENIEERKKKVEFLETGKESTYQVTKENNEKSEQKMKKPRKKKKKANDDKSGQSSVISETDTDIASAVETNGTEKAKSKKNKKSKKEKEKERQFLKNAENKRHQ